MGLYVDNGEYRLGRMITCHMMADTHDELMTAARALGLRPEWVQKPGTEYEHFDVSKAKRAIAVKTLCATELTGKQIIRQVVWVKRRQSECSPTA